MQDVVISPILRYVLLHHVMGELEGIRGAWGYPEVSHLKPYHIVPTLIHPPPYMTGIPKVYFPKDITRPQRGKPQTVESQ